MVTSQQMVTTKTKVRFAILLYSSFSIYSIKLYDIYCIIFELFPYENNKRCGGQLGNRTSNLANLISRFNVLLISPSFPVIPNFPIKLFFEKELKCMILATTEELLPHLAFSW